MKNRMWLQLAWFVVLAGGVIVGRTQNYQINWSSVAAGGGSSTGALYSIKGTVGKPVALSTGVSGGRYAVIGGIWATYVLQMPGAPQLNLLTTSTNTVVVFWPTTPTSWRVQQNTNPSSSNWQPGLELVRTDGTNNFIIVTQLNGSRFYRLAQP